MDRVVKVVLRGDVKDLVGKLSATSSAVKATASSITSADRESVKFRQNLTAFGDTAGKIGLVAAAGVGVAIRAYANFDEAIARVRATGEDARGNMDALTQAAIDFGASTQFSATEAANAIEEMIKAGVSAKDVLGGGLEGALNLASAGGLGVAEAAGIAATALQQFGLDGDQATRVSDILAAAAGKAQGDVSDFALALKYAGVPAKALGVSVEETTGVLAAFAEKGILADQAGTNLRAVLLSLAAPTKVAQKTLDQYGLSLYGADGKFVGLTNAAGQLQDRLSKLSEPERNKALQNIFGREAIAGAITLYESGAQGVKKWTKAVDDQGFAADVAAQKMDTLKGDFEQFSGALETALIGTGEGANGPLRELVQLLTGLVGAYNALPGPIKTTVLAGAGFTAALGGTAFVAARAIDAYSNLKSNLTSLGGSLDQVNKKAIATRVGIGALGVGLASVSAPAHEASDELGALVDVAAGAAIGFAVGGPWGAAIGGGAALLSSLSGGGESAAESLAGLTDTLDDQTGAITENTAEWVANKLQTSGAADTLSELGLSLATLTDAALGNADALAEVGAKTKEADFDQTRALGSVLQMSGALKEGAAADREKSAALKESTEAQGASTDAFGATADAADLATKAIKSFNDSLDGLLDPLLSQEDASNAWKDSLAALAKDVEKNGKSLDDNTKSGRANQDALRERVQALKDSVAADAEAGVSQEDLVAKLKRGRKAILDAGEAAGFSRKEMKSYLAQLGLTPEQVDTLIQADAGDAKSDISTVNSGMDGLDGRTATVYIKGVKTGADLGAIAGQLGQIDGRTVKKRATGGPILRAAGGSVVGAGTGTSDSIPAIGPGGSAYRLSNGEHVMTAHEVNQLGGQNAAYALRAAIRAGQFSQGFASGGAVGGGSSASPGPFSASIVGARFRLDSDGLMTAIDGRVEMALADSGTHKASQRRAGRGSR